METFITFIFWAYVWNSVMSVHSLYFGSYLKPRNAREVLVSTIVTIAITIWAGSVVSW